MAAAAMNEHLVDLETVIDCEHGNYVYEDVTFKDEQVYRRLVVSHILIKHSRIGSLKIALKLGDVKLHDYLRRFGFEERAGIHLAGESTGLVSPLTSWFKLSIARMSTGQGLSVTPLQLAMGMAVIANGGKLMTPRVIRSVKDDAGLEIVGFAPEVVREVISTQTANTMKKILAEATSDEGTASKARVRGFTVAGSTGSVQKVIKGAVSGDTFYCSFVGFMPVENPQFVCLILIEQAQPGWGGQIAAPVFSRVSEKVALHLKLKPSDRPE